VLLYKNWDTVKAKAGQLWAKVKEAFGGIYNWGVNKIQPVVNFFRNLADKFNQFKSAISRFKPPKWVSTIGSTISSAVKKAKNSFDVGTNHVPYDMVANIHQGEMIIPARQSAKLRQAGVTIDNIDRITEPTKVITNNNSQTSGPTVIIQNINAKGITAAEVIEELVPQLKLKLANM